LHSSNPEDRCGLPGTPDRWFGSLYVPASDACCTIRNEPMAAHPALNGIIMPRLNTSTTVEELSRDDCVFLREEMRHEDDLINARLSWLINSQSFLFGAFAITPNGSPSSKFTMYAKLNVVLVDWLPVAGILSVAVSYLTILAAILHIRTVRRLARGKYPPNLLPLQGEIFVGRMGLSGAVVTPLIFLAVWLAIILEAWSGN
jgi:hypothetical protein